MGNNFSTNVQIKIYIMEKMVFKVSCFSFRIPTGYGLFTTFTCPVDRNCCKVVPGVLGFCFMRCYSSNLKTIVSSLGQALALSFEN